MPAYKDKNRNTWYSSFKYKDFTGKTRSKTKRGFSTKKEAVQWENNFKLQQSGELDMYMCDFYEIYLEYCSKRFKENTIKTKESAFATHILPFFENKRMNEITPAMVTIWQNILLDERDNKGEGYSSCYLKTVHNQLSAIFNFAIQFYNLPKNPAKIAGNMGKETAPETPIWTVEDFKKFIAVIEDKPQSSCAFRILFWGGIRLGELLALTPSDFDFKESTVSITKSYQRIDGQDIVTSPKTKKSVREVSLPKDVMDEVEDLIACTYGIEDNDRIFTFTKSFLHHEMDRGCKESGVERIKIHALRHSHISLLIEKGFTVVDIGNRVGHESVYITLHYAHMFPDKQEEMKKALEEEMENV